VPTSLFVIAAGIGMMRLSSAPGLPVIYPGTSTAFQHVAWGVVFALALGSALFPVADLFGYVQGQANATFRVLDFVLLGCLIYVILSGLTWLLVRVLEAVLAPPAAKFEKGGMAA
jgi:hypothetical protein